MLKFVNLINNKQQHHRACVYDVRIPQKIKKSFSLKQVNV